MRAGVGTRVTSTREDWRAGLRVLMGSSVGRAEGARRTLDTTGQRAQRIGTRQAGGSPEARETRLATAVLDGIHLVGVTGFEPATTWLPVAQGVKLPRRWILSRACILRPGGAKGRLRCLSLVGLVSACSAELAHKRHPNCQRFAAHPLAETCSRTTPNTSGDPVASSQHLASVYMCAGFRRLFTFFGPSLGREGEVGDDGGCGGEDVGG